jgi:SM-20-related protein
VTFSTELVEGGICIQDEFLTVSQVDELRECLQARRARGEFSAARIGAGQALQRREEVRGDFTCWLNEPLFAAETHVLACFERLRLQLNREAFLGLLELELHYAAYPPGAGYARHVDQPRGKARRKVSLVLYLNRGWEPDAAGELRIFGAGEKCCDVQPLGGRLVCFLTAGQEHCVRAATRERLTLAGWLCTRD